jgi:hypothetical protein
MAKIAGGAGGLLAKGLGGVWLGLGFARGGPGGPRWAGLAWLGWALLGWTGWEVFSLFLLFKTVCCYYFLFCFKAISNRFYIEK